MTVRSSGGRSWALAIAAATIAIAGCVGDAASPGAEVASALSDACQPASAAWAPGRAYAIGDLALHGGVTYRARQAHTSAVGWEPPAVPALWVIPTPCGLAPWAAQTDYPVGSRVTYAGQIYECVQGHVSLPGWDPVHAPALWRAIGPAGDDCNGRGTSDGAGGCLCDLGATGAACEACADGFTVDGSGRCVLVHDGDYAVWPNPVSRASSDPWLVVHHDDVALLRPNVLVLLYANVGTADGERALVERIGRGLAEGSRARGYADPSAVPQIEYQFRFVDLRDGVDGRPPAPAGYPYENSTLYPRKPPGSPGAWMFDYALLYTQEYARYLGYPDPARPGQFRDLCSLVEDGTIHEVWAVGSADVPDVNAAEVLGMTPNYTATGNRIPDSVNRCAGNGCFDAEVPFCGRTLRIGWVNYNRGPGCYMHNQGHGIEWGIKDSIPALQEWFLPFAGFDLDRRYPLPFNNLYWMPCDSSPCISYPTPTHGHFATSIGTFDVDPFDAVCGNVHFPPNGVQHYDYFNPQTVMSSCESFGRHDGPGGADVAEPVDPSRWSMYWPYDDCGGEFLTWWYQNMPGHGSNQTFGDGRPMQSMWPFYYY